MGWISIVLVMLGVAGSLAAETGARENQTLVIASGKIAELGGDATFRADRL